MIIVVDRNENINQHEDVTYRTNIDAVIEDVLHNQVDGIILTDSIDASDVARLKAIVKRLDNETIILPKGETIDSTITEIEEIFRLRRLGNMTFSDPLAPNDIADQNTVL